MKTRLAFVIVIMFFGALIAIPRLIDIGQFVTADEPMWANYSANFYYALSHQDFRSTFQSGYPGVTTMTIGAIAYQIAFPEYKQVGEGQTGDKNLLIAFQNHGPNPVTVLAVARIIQSLVILATLGISYLYARPLLLPLPTLLGFLFIAFDPFHLAHSRVLHTNALLSSFMFLATLSFLHYLQYHRWHALLVSSLAAALGVLTVTTGLAILPMMLLIAGTDLFFRERVVGELHYKVIINKYLLPVALWGLLILLFVGLLFPAVWVDPSGTLSEVIDFTALSAKGASSFRDTPGSSSSSMGQGSNPVLFYLRAYLWRSTPLVWAGIVLALVAIVAARGKWLQASQRWNVSMLFLTVLVFFSIMSLGTKKFDRYLLPIFLPLNLIAGVGWLTAITWMASRFKALRNPYTQYIAVGILAVGQFGFAIPHHPYYLTYYNPLMGKADQVPGDMFTGWGEGLNEAALYLIEIPDINNKRVFSWYSNAFNWYAQGLGLNVDPIYTGTETSAEGLGEYLSGDYAVIYINQWQRNMPRQLIEALTGVEPIHTVQIGGVDFVRIYDLSPFH